MKTLHTILTVLIVVFLILGIMPFIGAAKSPGGGTLGGILGNLIAYLTIPSILYAIRYFVGKKNK